MPGELVTVQSVGGLEVVDRHGPSRSGLGGSYARPREDGSRKQRRQHGEEGRGGAAHLLTP